MSVSGWVALWLLALLTLGLRWAAQSSLLDTVESLIAGVEARDPYTSGHSKRVWKFSLLFGAAMGLDGAADALCAMTSGRAYQHDRTIAQALSELRVHSRRQFDPRVVEAVLRVPPACLAAASTMWRN